MIKDDNTNLIIDPSYPLPGAGVLMADKALKEVQGLAVRSQLLSLSVINIKAFLKKRKKIQTIR